MFAGLAILTIAIRLVIIIAVIVFAVKLLKRVTEISEAQTSIIRNQTLLIALISNQKKSNE
jgi:hypothetical protein